MQTLQCLVNLDNAVAAISQSASVGIYLLDDGSSDGTAEAVRRQFPAATVREGDGSLFWAGAMRQLMAETHRDATHLLWLNDDVELRASALAQLVEVEDNIRSKTGIRPVVVGALRDPQTHTCSYGGVLCRPRWNSLTFSRLPISSQLQMCQTMNGNCVLIPTGVVEQVGLIDECFSHCMADFDYGLRACRAGIPIVVAPGSVGDATRNPAANTWQDRTLPRSRRMRLVCSKKGLPPAEYRCFVRRHGGVTWPCQWAMPYAWVLSGRGHSPMDRP